MALKALRNVNSNGSPTDVAANGNTLIVDMIKEVVTLKVNNVDLSTKTQNELQTDGAIQRSNLKHLDGRDLQTASAWLDPSTGANLDMGGGGGSWNQFETNQRLFNVKNTYDESIYTKKLDKSKLSREQLEKADRIAREIEGQQSSNIHMQIERGQAEEGEFDEEDLYSGVLDQSKVKNNKSLKKAPAAASASSGSKWERQGKNSPSVEQGSGRPTPPPGMSAEPAANSAPAKTTEAVAAAPAPADKKPAVLNPNAKEFTFNAKAPEFRPSFAAPVVMPPNPYGNAAMFGAPMMGAPVMIDESGNPVMYAPMPQQAFYPPPGYMMPGPMQPMMYPQQPYMAAPYGAPMHGVQQQQHRGNNRAMNNPNYNQNQNK